MEQLPGDPPSPSVAVPVGPPPASGSSVDPGVGAAAGGSERADATGADGMRADPQQPAAMRPAELMDVVMDLPSAHPIVVLREVDPPRRLLRFPVGLSEGIGIAYGLRRVATPRPLTHELMCDSLASFGIALELVRITAVSEGTLMAVIVLSGGGRNREVDCRPSDALALAARQPLTVPIVVAEEVLTQVGELR